MHSIALRSSRSTAAAFGLAATLALLGFMFTASQAQAASSISIDTVPPPGCQLSGAQINITGSATADAPPGQLEQYKVDIDWGDGAHTTALGAGSFGNGHGIGGPLPFNGSHTYTTAGTYNIVATVYHSSLNGNDNVDSGANSFVVCIVEPLEISKTAVTSFDRDWTWTIEKSADDVDFTIADGESFEVNYTVAVDASSVDSNIMVEGEITIASPDGNPDVEIENVTDTLSLDGSVTVSCPGGLPQTLSGGDSLVCTYSQALNDNDEQTNTAHVDTDVDILDANSNTVDVEFTDPTNETDECVTVDDTNAAGPQDQVVCGDDAPDSWEYSLTFGKGVVADVTLVCGVNAYENTASFTSNDSDEDGSDSVTVNAEVACAPGCTLTQGYWKTHNTLFKGGASKHADDNWANVGGPGAAFFTSGSSWFNIFWMPPKGGNVYLQLAHQYMAAKLNIFNGAGPTPAVTAAINGAQAFFVGKTPATNLTNPQKTQAKGWASTLGAFNEGSIGPGHCDEQN